jgi:hypothetical protein
MMSAYIQSPRAAALLARECAFHATGGGSAHPPRPDHESSFILL